MSSDSGRCARARGARDQPMHMAQETRPFSLHFVHLRSWCTCALEVALPYRSRSAFLSPPQSWQIIKPSPPHAVPEGGKKQGENKKKTEGKMRKETSWSRTETRITSPGPERSARHGARARVCVCVGGVDSREMRGKQSPKQCRNFQVAVHSPLCISSFFAIPATIFASLPVSLRLSLKTGIGHIIGPQVPFSIRQTVGISTKKPVSRDVCGGGTALGNVRETIIKLKFKPKPRMVSHTLCHSRRGARRSRSTAAPCPRAAGRPARPQTLYSC